MNSEVIKSLIRQLHDTLDGTSEISDTDREQLRQLSVDLQALVAQPNASVRSGHQNIIDRLNWVVTRFEVSHPDLTATMSQISKALGDMGI